VRGRKATPSRPDHFGDLADRSSRCSGVALPSSWWSSVVSGHWREASTTPGDTAPASLHGRAVGQPRREERLTLPLCLTGYMAWFARRRTDAGAPWGLRTPSVVPNIRSDVMSFGSVAPL
jgi:hypothetical protein